jgi:polyisoprenoid-binding protein YceI
MKVLFKFCLLWVAMLVLQPARAQVLFKTDVASAAFFSETPVENIDAVSKSMTAIIKPEGRIFAFSVPIRSFEFKNSLMQEHFNDKYLESDKYPKATFAGVILEDIDLSKPGTYEVTAKGKFTVHGVTQERTIKSTVVSKDGALQIISEFPVKIADHKIEIPKLVFTNIAESVLVKVNATLNPVK